ncbi:MAG: hypothetical protein WBD00_02515 [Candidatus Omnitrophota bacterium]
MRMHKTITMGLVVTVMAIGYVHQQVEIVKAGYSLQKSRKHLSCLVDQNSKLMYNLSKLESPRNLLTSLNGEEIEFASNKIRRTNSYQIAQADSSDGDASQSIIGKFLDLFTVNAEAKPRE